jgi:ProP effector
VFASDPTPQAKAAPLIATLAEKFPAAFQIDESRRRPLRIGIGGDLRVEMAGVMDDSQIAAALSVYTSSVGYLRACHEGADRIDLQGRAAGEVTEQQAAFARRKLEGRGELGNGHDKEAPPRPASLADLRARARARREGGAK